MSANSKSTLVHCLSVLSTIAFVLSACVAPAAPPPAAKPSQAPAATTAPSAPPAAKPVYGGVLKVAADSVPPNLDGQIATSIATGQIVAHIFESLVEFGENFDVTPMLAESWDISQDGKTYTFHLRKGRKFHNGKEMTSKDVIASLDRYLRVSSRKNQFEGVLTAYEATDDYTVVMRLARPSAAWLSTLALPTSAVHILPKEILEGKGKETLEAKDLVGTGPYQLVEYKPDQVIRLKRFQDYQPLPGERNGLGGAKIAYFDEIQFIPVTEVGARLAGLETGTYDWIQSVPGKEVDRIQKSSTMAAGVVRPKWGFTLVFNHAEKFSGDVKFRQAILAGVDMEAIALASTGGNRNLFSLDTSLWPQESIWYFEDAGAAKLYNQKNIDKAKQLLKEAGYNGEEIVLAVAKEYDHDYGGIMGLSDQLRKLGVNNKVETYDWPSTMAKWQQKTGWQISATRMATPNLLNPNNWSAYWGSKATSPSRAFYASAKMDSAFDKLDAATTLAERKESLKGVQQVYYDELPYIQTHQLYDVVAYRSNIKDYKGWYTNRFFGVWRQP